jgi:hypothetical protein
VNPTHDARREDAGGIITSPFTQDQTLLLTRTEYHQKIDGFRSEKA